MYVGVGMFLHAIVLKNCELPIKVNKAFFKVWVTNIINSVFV